jgi:predicted Zn-dependent protease
MHGFRSFHVVAASAIACAFCFVAHSEEPKKSPPTKEQIAQWIRDLGDNDFEARQAASKRLWEAGQAAEAPLREALKAGDPEVVRRARELLDKFKWGIYPDTQAKIVQLIQQYQSGNDEENSARTEAITKLLEEGNVGCAALGKIIRAEENPAARTGLIATIADEYPRALPAALANRNSTALEDLLEQCALAEPDARVYNYAAYCLLRGRLENRIKYFANTPAGVDVDAMQKTLVHLLRVKGDFAKARKVADKDEELLTRLLIQERDWKTLAKRKPADDASREDLVVHAAHCRLSGDTKTANEVLDSLRKLVEPNADTPPDGSDPELPYVAKALLLNDRAKDAMELLTKGAKHNQNVEMAVQVLAAQQRFKEAFELLDNVPGTGAEGTRSIDLLRARMLIQLGDRDEAATICKKLAEKLGPDDVLISLVPLLEDEYRAGMKELAQKQLLKALEPLLANPDRAVYVELFEIFFPQQGNIAALWWEALVGAQNLDRDRKVNVAALWKQLQGIMTGKADDLPKLLEEMSSRTADLAENEREPFYFALAHAAQASGRKKDAQAYLEKACAAEATNPQAFMKLGDHHAAQETWEKAADAYRRGAEKHRGNAVLAYLYGWALTKDGHADEGKKQIELAHMIPLGSPERRFDFMQELLRRDFADDARRERELVLQIDDTMSRYTAEALRREAIDAIVKKEYLKAAEFSDASMLRVHNQSINFAVSSAYFQIPQQTHRLRARGLLDQGKIEEALKEADYCLANYPGDIEVPILLTEVLEKKGRKKEAEQIYSKVLGVMKKFCEQYPKSGWGHNTLAWQCACCRRDLEDGLKHAQKANDLSPDNAGYLDTLAEIHFQMGNKAKALEVARKCAGLEPKRAYFRKQLKRIEKGDPKADVPEELGDAED